MSILSEIFYGFFGRFFPRDAEAEVERRAEGKERLDWPDSIVDLLKALGRDSSFEARRQLAGEMGRTNYSGTAEENIWLHSRVMEKVRRREW